MRTTTISARLSHFYTEMTFILRRAFNCSGNIIIIWWADATRYVQHPSDTTIANEQEIQAHANAVEWKMWNAAIIRTKVLKIWLGHVSFRMHRNTQTHARPLFFKIGHFTIIIFFFFFHLYFAARKIVQLQWPLQAITLFDFSLSICECRCLCLCVTASCIMCKGKYAYAKNVPKLFPAYNFFL